MIEVRRFTRFEDLQPLREALASIHARSRRDCPFSTLDYLQAFHENDQFHPSGDGSELWFLVAFESDLAIAYLPMRSVAERIFGCPTHRLEFLTTHDADRPHVVSSIADEARATQAFHGFVMGQPKAWSFLELRQQDSTSRQLAVPADPSRYYTRLLEAPQNSTVGIRWTTPRDYFSSLKKKTRSNTSRQLRNLLAAGKVHYLSSQDPAVVPRLFEVYLSIEERSWKFRVDGTIGRHPARVAFFRSLLRPDQPMRPCISLLLLDGTPIAGLIDGRYGRGQFALQIAFDESQSRLSPGATVLFMSLCRAIDQQLAFYNLMSGFTYYKTFWQAESQDTKTVQLIRRGSLHHLKARAGELRRRWIHADPEVLAQGDLTKSQGAHSNPFRNDAQAQWQPTRPADASFDLPSFMANLPDTPSPSVDLYDSAALAAYLPFNVQ